MADDIDIVVSVREKAGSKAVVEALRAKLQEYRQELTLLTAQELQYGGQGGAAKSFELIKGEVDDTVAKFSQLGQAIDVSSKTAVAAFQGEVAELTNFIATLGMGNEAALKLSASLEALKQRQIESAAAMQKAGPVYPANAGPLQQFPSRFPPNAGPQQPASGTPFPANAGPQPPGFASEAAGRLTTDINTAIGAYVRLGRIIDITSMEAVAAYRAQGDALAANLARIGATDTELNKLGSSIARVEQAYGAFNAEAQNGVQTIERIPVTARRGANAMATLAFGIQAGGTSARTMSIALGSTISAMAAFSDSAKIAAAATGIGALVTVLAVVIGLFYDLNKEEKQAEDGFKNLGELSVKKLQILTKNSDAYVHQLELEANAAADVVEEERTSSDLVLRMQAQFDVITAHKTLTRYQTELEKNRKFHDAMVAAQTQEGRELEEQGRKEIEKAEVMRTDFYQGTTASRELAARQERDEALKQLAKKTGAEKDITAAREGILRQYTLTVQGLERDRQKKVDDLDTQFHDQQVTAAEKLAEDVFGVQRQQAQRKYEADAKRIKEDRDLNPEEKRRLTERAEDARTTTLIAIERDRTEEIAKIREEGQGKLDELSGMGVNEAKVAESYKKQVDALAAAIASTDTTPVQKEAARKGLDIIEALIPKEVAKERLDQIDKDINRTLESQGAYIQRADDLLKSHNITTEENRQRTVVALEKQRDIVAQSIPLLEEQADLLPGNAEAREKVEQMTTKLLELTIAVAHAKDQFYLLKEAGISATEDAITKFITSLPEVLGGQGLQIQNIKTIKDNLASAKQQMDFFMNQPRTSETLDRITALRTEIAKTSLELNQAKSELKTWESLFVDAARSIVQALYEVESRMLAVYIIQQALRLFGGGVAGLSSSLQVAGEVGSSVVPAATGGLIRGPGTGTSDSIAARLSNNEYVINAAAVGRVGVGFLDAINGAANMPSISHRHRFADGGLVSSDTTPGYGSMEATLGLEEGLVVRHMQTSAGVRAILTAIGSNRKAVKALIGG